MRTVTDWSKLRGKEAAFASTGGLETIRKWVDEPAAIVKWVLEHLPKGSYVADLGCGTGRVSIPLCVLFNTISIDYHTNMPLSSPQPLRIHPYGEAFSVHGVISCYVMQHIPPELLSTHLSLLLESSWEYLFLLESTCPSDFEDFNFRTVFETWASTNHIELVNRRDWEFEPTVSACTYKRNQL